MPIDAAAEDALRHRAKSELRKRLRSVRAALPASASRERSALLCARLCAHEAFQSARTVGLFMSRPDEVQLASVIDAARAAGKRVVLPVVVATAERSALTFRAPFDGNTPRVMVPSAFDILEPGDDSPAVDLASIDVMVVPALAVDPRGHRIGYGAGYYDRTLPLATRAATVAVAFDFQLIAEVPDRAGDVAVQWIVTDVRVLRAEA